MNKQISEFSKKDWDEIIKYIDKNKLFKVNLRYNLQYMCIEIFFTNEKEEKYITLFHSPGPEL